MVEMLSRQVIGKWLDSLAKKGDMGRAREGATLYGIQKYTGIPLMSLRMYAKQMAEGMSKPRQLLLSKVIAMVENGQLDFVIEGKYGQCQLPRKVAVIRDKPVPLKKYGFKFTPQGVRLTYVDRPKPFVPMPSFKQVLFQK